MMREEFAAEEEVDYEFSIEMHSIYVYAKVVRMDINKQKWMVCDFWARGEKERYEKCARKRNII